MKWFLIYFIIIQALAVVMTVYDKRAAIKGKRRVSERTLLLTSALGGAPSMYVTMLIIRHKTKKPLFMIGIPVIFIAWLLICFGVYAYVFKIIPI